LNNPIDFELLATDDRALGEASAGDLMRMCELLAQGAVVSEEASRQMVEIMLRQQYMHLFPRYFDFNPWGKELKIEQRLQVANKIGLLLGAQIDMGLVFLPDETAFAYCVMTDDSEDLSLGVESEGA